MFVAGLCSATNFFIHAEHPIQNSLRAVYARDLIEKSRQLKLSETRGWRTLLHYDSFLGRTKSEARDKNPGGFFTAPTGLTDPEAELEATIQAILTDTDSPEPARCRFPAREIFLVRELAIDTKRLPPVNCVKYRDWLQHLSPDSASIVFASFYMGNPSSMFGHTFLRFHNKNRNALMDGSFNYAANAEQGNAIVYAWLGMTGGFPGTYSMHPYYVKINEYNDMESRDLWEFPLKLTDDELQYVLAHLWEMSSVYFPYYYLDENCSYQLLTLLETVRPGTKLTNRFSLFVTPTDTLHTLAESGFLTGESRYRAAVFTRYMTFYEHASGEARSIFSRLREERNLPADKQQDSIVAVDMLLEFYKYSNEYNMENWRKEDLAHYHSLLSWRAQAPADSGLEQFIKLDEDKNPLNGFKSTQIHAGYYQSTVSGAVVFGLRPALRELHDASRGFSPWSQIQIMGFSASYLEAKNLFRLEEWNIVDIFALAPWQAQVHKFSYRLRTGLYRHDVLTTLGASTLSWDSTAGGGITLLPFRPLGWFALAEASAQVGSLWDNSLRITPGLLTGFKINWSTRLATYIAYGVDYGLVSNAFLTQKIDVRNAWAFFDNWALEINAYFARAELSTSPQEFTRVSGAVKTYF